MPAPLALVPVAGAAGASSSGAAIAFGTGFTVGTTASILAGKNPVWNKAKELHDYLLIVPMPMSDPLVRLGPKISPQLWDEHHRDFTRKADRVSDSVRSALSRRLRKLNRIQAMFYSR